LKEESGRFQIFFICDKVNNFRMGITRRSKKN